MLYKLFRFLFLLFLCSFSIEVAAKTNLKIATFNIRWNSGKDGANDWVNRKEYFVKYMNRLDADIVCMQEVMRSQQNYLTEHLTRYDYIGAGGEDGKRSGEFAPIFYNRKKFKLIDSGHFWLSETPDVPGSIGWDTKNAHIVTWVKLETSKNQLFYVINSHFDWNSVVAREKSARLIVEWIKARVKDEHVIVTGDFNSSPESGTHKVMVESGILNDSYMITPKRKGVSYSFHDFGRRQVDKRKILDYILVSNGIKVRKVEIVKEKLKDGRYMSDHNPVIAKISF